MRVPSLLGSLLSLSVCLVAASPVQRAENEAKGGEHAAETYSFAGKNLRILPLGASITFGLHSTDNNGYREHLRQSLTGANVTYIGTQCTGTMKNSNSEGHPGHFIGDMLGYATPNLPLNPNVVLIYVGTNDVFFSVDPAHAPQRMADLVSGLAAKLPPKTLFLVGNLFLETDPKVQQRIDTFNTALPKALAPLSQKGINWELADFSKALTTSDLHCDGEHPNDRGYKKMADVFSSGLVKAASSTRIPEASKPTGTQKQCSPLAPTPTGTCPPKTTKAAIANQPAATHQ